MHIGYEWCWSLQVVNLRTLSLSIGVEDDTMIEGHSDWTGQISFTFIYTRHESFYILTELVKFLLLSSIKVINLSTFSFVNRCGGWHYWWTFWLKLPNFFYFHLYKAWILVHSDWTDQISFTFINTSHKS